MNQPNSLEIVEWMTNAKNGAKNKIFADTSVQMIWAVFSTVFIWNVHVHLIKLSSKHDRMRLQHRYMFRSLVCLSRCFFLFFCVLCHPFFFQLGFRTSIAFVLYAFKSNLINRFAFKLIGFWLLNYNRNRQANERRKRNRSMANREFSPHRVERFNWNNLAI